MRDEDARGSSSSSSSSSGTIKSSSSSSDFALRPASRNQYFESTVDTETNKPLLFVLAGDFLNLVRRLVNSFMLVDSSSSSSSRKTRASACFLSRPTE